MKRKEVIGSLFDLGSCELFPGSQKEDYVLAHCIASDFGMYGGIARDFVEIYDMKRKLFSHFRPNHYNATRGDRALIGSALQIENVYNLITKGATFELPTYHNLELSLVSLKTQMLAQDQLYLAIPLIGCGIDGLSWDRVSAIIDSVFQNTGINILVVRWECDGTL